MQDQVRDARQVYHFWLDDTVLDLFGKELGPYGLAIYMALARRAKRGESYPSVKRLGQDTGMSPRSVRTNLKKLETLGLITITPRHSDAGDPTSNLYTILDLSHLTTRGTAPPTGPPAPPAGPPAPPAGGVLHHVQEVLHQTAGEVVPLEVVPDLSSNHDNHDITPALHTHGTKRPGLAPDDWLYLLLEQYKDDFDAVALNDAKWWDNLANSFAVFDQAWVTLAFAGLAAYLDEVGAKRPHGEKEWKKWVRRHLNLYWNQHVKREAYGNGKSHR